MSNCKICSQEISWDAKKREALKVRGPLNSTQDGQIPPKSGNAPSSNVFGSGSTGFLTGTEGSVTYSVDGSEFTITWDNPWAGSNSADASVSGPHSRRYHVYVGVGSGNHSRNKYWLYEKPPPFSLREFLPPPPFDPSRGIRSLAPPNQQPISVRNQIMGI